MVAVNTTVADLPTTVLPSVQTNASASPSGSLDSEPFNVTGVPAGPAAGWVWSAPALATGGALVMVTWVTAVEERPPASVTVSVYVCVPIVAVKDTTADLPTTVVPSVQTKVSASPSGSLDSEPSSVTGAPPGPVAGRVWSAPALATGGWFVDFGAEKRLNRTWFTPTPDTGASSDQTTLRLPFLSAAAWTLEDEPKFDTFCGVENVASASTERAKKTFARPGVVSSQFRSISPVALTVIHGLVEFPGLFEIFVGIEKLVSPLLKRAKNMASLKDWGSI